MQRGMDAVEFILLVEELEPLHVPGDMAIGAMIFMSASGRSAPFLLLEITPVGEGQLRPSLVQNGARVH